MYDFIKELQEDFLQEAQELLNSLQEKILEAYATQNLQSLHDIFRILHNLKGTSQSVSMENYSKLVHSIEDFVDLKRKQSERPLLIEADMNFLLKCYDSIYAINTKMMEGELLDENIELGQYSFINSYIHSSPVNKSEQVSAVEESPNNEGQIEEEAASVILDHPMPSSKPVVEKKTKKVNQFVKCPTSKIDRMLNYLGEVITQINQIESDCTKELERKKNSLLKYVNELHYTCLSLTSVPFSSIKAQLQRAFSEALSMTGKKAILEIIGESIEVNKFILENLVESMIHIIRNSVDHGLPKTSEEELSEKE